MAFNGWNNPYSLASREFKYDPNVAPSIRSIRRKSPLEGEKSYMESPPEDYYDELIKDIGGDWGDSLKNLGSSSGGLLQKLGILPEREPERPGGLLEPAVSLDYLEKERDRELGEDLEKTGNLFKELSKYGDPGVEGNLVKPIVTGTPPPAKITRPRGYRMVEGPTPSSLLTSGQLEEATRERIAYFLANSGLLGERGLGQSALTHNTLFGPRSA